MLYNRLSWRKVASIIRYFCEDLTATSTARLVGVSRNTINTYFNEFRMLIFDACIQENKQELGEYEADESYFGAKRIRGKRGRGAAGKTPVFGLLKRGGKVFVTIVPNCSKDALMPIIQGRIIEGSTIHTDGWKAYDGLILNGYDHYRVHHCDNEFARGKSHVNGIESFWSYAKARLAKFNGCTNEKFVIHLKECECRFNHRNENLQNIIKILIKRKQKSQ
jgi:transposase-like protein